MYSLMKSNENLSQDFPKTSHMGYGMKRKKVLFAVESMGGGVFTYIADLANELVKKHDIYIAYGLRKQTPKNYKDYFNPKIRLICVDSFTRSINPVQDIRAYFELKKMAEQIKPDIIHLHSSKAGVLGRIAFRKLNIPLFYTPHGYSFLMQDQNIIKRRLYNAIEHFCGKINCTTICCSKGEYAEALKITGQAACIDNGINIKLLQKSIDEADSGYPDHKDTFTVFTLGRICRQKNPKMFNEIAQSLPDIRFIWIGDGELRNELHSPNITVTGWVERSQAVNLSLSADAFILTSSWEGLPISLLEAMYMKKPCIVSDVIGNHDVIKTGVNGYVCKNVNDFITAINSVQASFPDNLVQKSYSEICTHYNIVEMAYQYEKIYFRQ